MGDGVGRDGALPSDELEVLLVRHGETEWNRQGRMQGHQDPPLNDAGAAQAGVVAQFLASGACGEVHGVYSSDLRRAAATAHAIAEQCKPAATSGAVVVDPAFRERCLGKMEGLTVAEAAVREPEALQRWRSGKLVEGAEAKDVVERRVMGALERIATDGLWGRRIVVVTHGGIINCVHRFVEGKPFPGRIANTSLSTLRLRDDGGRAKAWRALSFASCPHLAGSSAGKGVGEGGVDWAR